MVGAARKSAAVTEVSPEMQKLLADQDAKAARRKSCSKTVAASSFARTLAEVDEMLRSGKWDGAGPRHLVGLYERMFAKCYGIAPELSPSERHRALLLAGNLVKRTFGGDVDAAIDHLNWVWTREISREKWRKANGSDAPPLGAPLVLGGRLVRDQRVSVARGGGRT